MQNKIFITTALILGASFVFGVIIATITFYNVRALDNVISVTGSAKKAVTSDAVKWSIAFNRNTTQSTLQTGYSRMAKDLEIIKKFLVDNGIGEDALTINTIQMNEVWKNYEVAAENKEYTLYQNVEIDSDEVDLVNRLSKEIGGLIGQGIIVTSNYLSYTYSGLAEQRVALLSEAVADARARAEQLVAGTGKKIGKLRSASSGVVQVLASNSIDISDYGQYDTSTVDKDVMVTVKASFLLK